MVRHPFLLAALLVACTPTAPADSAPSSAPEPGSGSAEPGRDSPAGAAPTGSAPTGSAPTAASTSEPSSQPSSQPVVGSAPATALPRPAWISARVEEARARLAGSPAGQLLWRSIEAHGGLERWYANGPVSFRFRYAPETGRPAIDTRQTVDTWSARAYHELVDQPNLRFGWDGARAWVSDPAVELPTNPRFWALTPYYFVGLPWVLADPGVQLEPGGELGFEGVTWSLLRATFAGVGDAPDDYYLLMVHPDSARVGGVIYVVSYPGFFPEGGHSPEKLMAFDGSQVVDGITLPERYRTFAMAGDSGWEQVGELVTQTTLSEVAFHPELASSAFEVPQGATVRDGY